jgi:hypothetical protein
VRWLSLSRGPFRFHGGGNTGFDDWIVVVCRVIIVREFVGDGFELGGRIVLPVTVEIKRAATATVSERVAGADSDRWHGWIPTDCNENRTGG